MTEKEKTHLEILDNHLETALSKTKALMTSAEVSAEFKEFSARLMEIDSMSKTIKVKDDETLSVAENSYSMIQGLIKTLDNKRTIVGAEYYNTVKLVNGFAKKIAEILEESKKRVNAEISGYKVVQRAAAEKIRLEKQKEIDKINDERQAEVDRLSRIQLMMTARTFGGIWIKTDGTEVTEKGCKTTESCDKLIEMFNNNFPPLTEFPHFPEKATETSEKIVMTINTLKATLISDAEKGLDNLKEKAYIQAKEDQKVMNNVVEKSTKDLNREANAEVKEAGKNLREFLKFNIHDPGLVPREFMSVDPAKIRDYVADHKDRIKKELKESNKQPITGVTFFVDVKHVSS
jgi:hypothetical protein